MTVGSVVNALAILRHLASGKTDGVNAIARAVSISPSSCFNILKTLVDEGFVDFHSGTKHYSLGDEPVSLFGAMREDLIWSEWLDAALARLAADYGVTCGLWRLAGKRVVLMRAVETSRKTRIHLVPGQRLPAYIGALGRCVAAARQLTIEEVTARIAELRWEQPPTPKAYWQGMRDVLRRGWTIDEAGYLHGVTTISAPIHGSGGKLSYCLTATMFLGQHDAATLALIGEQVADLARQASTRLMSPR